MARQGFLRIVFQGLRPFWVVIVVVRHMYILNVLAIIEQMCRVLRLNYVHLVLFRPTDVGAFIFFNLIVVKFECKYRVCVCSLVVVRHIVHCQCFSDYRADVSCCTTKIYLINIIQTDRCGRICLLNLIVAKIECKYRVHECSLVRCGTLYIVNVLVVTDQMCPVVLLKFV